MNINVGALHDSADNMPRFTKSVRAAASWSSLWFVTNIWPSGWFRLERRHGSLTARMCLDSVSDEQSPFGAPKSRTRET
jgi:hypothetical protein